MKVMTLLGTRPEIIKLSRTMAVLDDACEHVCVHTGQNYDYELNEIFYEELGIRRPDVFLNVAGATPAGTVAGVIAGTDQAITDHRPDAMLILGDTNSSLGVYAAKRRKIPIFHMEAGNRCFDLRVPEEINRRIVDHLSDINLVYTEHARRYLLMEGLPPDQIIKTGSPQKEVLNHHAADIARSGILTALGLKSGKYFSVSIHREENVDDSKVFGQLLGGINAVAEKYDMPMVFSCHPRTKERLKKQTDSLDRRIRVLAPLGFYDYIFLLTNAYCAISDSGTITEESSILGFPAITVRQAHERPEGMDEGTLIMTGLRKDRMIESIELTVRQYEARGPSRIAVDYDVDQVSWKVAKIIFSYTDYIRQKVWRNNA